MTCAETSAHPGLLDGALDGAAAAEAERHIEGCAECQRLSAEVAQLSDALRRDATRHRAPDGLRARIGASWMPKIAKRVVPFARRGFWWGAAGGTGLSASGGRGDAVAPALRRNLAQASPTITPRR